MSRLMSAIRGETERRQLTSTKWPQRVRSSSCVKCSCETTDNHEQRLVALLRPCRPVSERRADDGR
jgi:hypothetical protein